MDSILDYIIENVIRQYVNEEYDGTWQPDKTRVAQKPVRILPQTNQQPKPQTAQPPVTPPAQQPQDKPQPKAQPQQQTFVDDGNPLNGITRPMQMNFTPEQRREMARCNTCEMAPDQVWGIVIHYTGSDINNKKYNINTIKSGHRKRNYYQDIAYNFVIDRDGTILKGRDTNVRNQGTGNVEWNKHTLAICYIGGTDKKNGPRKRDGEPAGFDTRTPQQKASLVNLIKTLKRNFPTIADVRGHNQVPGSATGCPGFDAHKEYQHLVGKEDPNNPLYALRK